MTRMPASTMTSASPSFWHVMPRAPSSSCRLANGTNLWVLMCGRLARPCASQKSCQRRRLRSTRSRSIRTAGVSMSSSPAGAGSARDRSRFSAAGLSSNALDGISVLMNRACAGARCCSARRPYQAYFSAFISWLPRVPRRSPSPLRHGGLHRGACAEAREPGRGLRVAGAPVEVGVAEVQVTEGAAERDRADVQAIVQARGVRLDLGEARAHLVELAAAAVVRDERRNLAERVLRHDAFVAVHGVRGARPLLQAVGEPEFVRRHHDLAHERRGRRKIDLHLALPNARPIEQACGTGVNMGADD